MQEITPYQLEPVAKVGMNPLEQVRHIKGKAAGLPTNLLLKPEAPTSRKGSGSVVTSVSVDRFGALKRGHP